jgi:hypothetical protein
LKALFNIQSTLFVDLQHKVQLIGDFPRTANMLQRSALLVPRSGSTTIVAGSRSALLVPGSKRVLIAKPNKPKIVN